MTTSIPTSVRLTSHADDRRGAHRSHTRRPRPDLPLWFGRATTTLYAVSAGLAAVFAGLAGLAQIGSASGGLFGFAAQVVGILQTGLVLGAGAWCFVAAGTRRVDPTTEQFNREWFLVAWFIPVAHILVPHRMFGDLWASAKWQQSDRRGANSPLAPRPWVMSAWATAWGASFVWALTVFFRDVDTTFLVVYLCLAGLSTALLGGVVRAMAHELAGHGEQ
ncbi:DUF4328 domain-containing protein [Knoellia subterranea]|nr:DUF4328 domain-containing protein [Knoellia subterranea]